MRITLTATNSMNGQSLLIRDHEFDREIEEKYFHVGLASEMKLNPELTNWQISGKSVTPVFIDAEGSLSFSDNVKLASKKELLDSDRSIGSIWEALNPNEILLLKDGCFILDDELDLSPYFS